MMNDESGGKEESVLDSSFIIHRSSFGAAWVTRDTSDPYGPALKCNFYTRLVVSGDRTPSGQAYDFQPEEVKDDVLKEDIEYLISLVHQQSACCGNSPGAAIHYFVLA